jgi:hypothetical protein
LFGNQNNNDQKMSGEEELEELKRRAAEMENNPSVCISHERVYEMVMARLKK